jgi:SAM-dependent methyltransferase
MLRANTHNLPLSTRARLLIKYAMYPGTNWISRDKSKVVKMFLRGTHDRPVRTLDCGCGNAYFAHQAVLRGSRCTAITIHEWEKNNCEEIRSFLDISPGEMEFRIANLESLAILPLEHGKYDQVLLLDVIEHILDARSALRQIYALTAQDGLVYITTPNRDWQGNADGIRVTRDEDGWHVRNGYTFAQLESLLEECGFEPVDRLRFGTAGSTLVTWIQHKLFGRWIDPLTVASLPILKLLAVALSAWRDTHTIFVLARKRRDPA